MSWTKDRWNKEQKKNALGMLQGLMKKIKDGELIVEDYGFWESTRGNWNFRVVAKESEDYVGFEQS